MSILLDKQEKVLDFVDMAPLQKDYYNILGISKDANDSDLKKSYYALAKKFHPDKNKEANAEEKFKEISKAYEILKDTSKRRLYDLQNDFDTQKTNTKATPSDYGTARSHSPKPTNYTFYQESETKTNQNPDSGHKFKFTSDKTNHRKTFDSKSKYEGMNYKPGFAPNPNASTQRRNFYEEYKKYFDSDIDFDELSDDELFNNESKPTNNTNGNAKSKKSSFYNGSNRPKWNKNWATEDNINRSQNEDSFLFGDEYSQDKKYTNDDPINGFKFHPSDPFELLEAFAMYKLFSQISDRLLRDINDDETLLNLAKIISSFNMTKNPSNDATSNSPPTAKTEFDSRSNKLNSKNSKYDAASDFVYNDLNDKNKNTKINFNLTNNMNNNKLPKMNKTNPSPFPTHNKQYGNTRNTDKEWEFEWLGKDQNQSKKGEASKLRSTLPTYIRTDSEDEFDEDADDDYEEVFSFNNKFKMNQIFSNR
jgi:curved DNA-binding protein CbpA